MAGYSKKRTRKRFPEGQPRVGGGVRRAPARTPRPAPRPPQAPAFTPPKVPVASGIAYNAPALSGGVGGGYDLSSDPAVQAASGLAAKIRANAQASALAKRKQAAIEYGDPTGVEGVDETTGKAARENPFSVLKNLEHSYEKGKGELEEELNKAGLFYSGYRGQQLDEAARGYQNQRYSAGTAFKGLMTDINDRLTDALLQADMYEAQGISGSDGGGYYGGYDEGGYDGVQRALRPGAGTTQGTAVNYGRPTYPARAPAYPSRRRRSGNPMHRRGL